jgi:aerobic carbon-monoxide dehydrogenase medium subunit
LDITFVEPADLAAVLVALRDAPPGLHLVAGGTGLLRRVRTGLLRPSSLVSIGRLPELQGIAASEDGGLRLGAALTMSAIARSAAVQERAPLLAAVCAETRTPQFRALATLGGVLADASPLDELPIALLALGASVRLVSSASNRLVAADDLVGDSGESRLAPDEILTDVMLPAQPPAARAAHERVVRREGI